MPRPKKSVAAPVESSKAKKKADIVEEVDAKSQELGLAILAAFGLPAAERVVLKAFPVHTPREVKDALLWLGFRGWLAFDAKTMLYKLTTAGELEQERRAVPVDDSENIVDTAKEILLKHMAPEHGDLPTSFTLAQLIEETGCTGLVKALKQLCVEGRVLETKGKGKVASRFEIVPVVADGPAPGDDDDADDLEDEDLDDDTDEGDDEDAEPAFVEGNGASNGSNGKLTMGDEGAGFTPTRYLKHDFTREEVDAFREEREQHDVVIEDLEKDLEEAQDKVKSLKKRIETRQEDGMALSKKIRFGSEMRSVPCEERREIDTRLALPTTGTLIMVTYRLDTDQAVDWRKLSANERQGKLWDEAPAPSPANGSLEVREASPLAESVAPQADLL